MNYGIYVVKMKFFTALTLLFFTSLALCSQLPPREIEDLFDNSSYIFIGTVNDVRLIEDLGKNGKKFEVEIQIISVMKGNFQEEIIKLHSNIGGIRGFSILLEEKQKGVFFLNSISKGIGKLTHWGSIALFNDSYFK